MEKISHSKHQDLSNSTAKTEVKHCQKPSRWYEELLEENGNDPRSVAGMQSIIDAGSSGGWMPTIDSRDARRTTNGNPPSKKT